jgi:phosphoglycolate phosphatase
MSTQKIDSIIFDLEGTLKMPTLMTSSGKISGSQAYPGVMEGLTYLSKKFPLFIVSNCYPGMLNEFLAIPDMKALFQDWTCYGETELNKGQNIKRIIEINKLQFPIYLGDSYGDFNASTEAGIPFLFICHGRMTKSEQYPTFSDFEGFVQHIDRLS